MSDKPAIYLSGPIRAVSESDAFHWRRSAEKRLEKHFHVLIPDPQNSEMPDDFLAMQDLAAIDQARFILAYVPEEAPCRGTMCELMYARMRLKTVLTWGAAIDDRGGPWVRWVSGGVQNCYSSLHTACAALVGVAAKTGTLPRPYAADLAGEVHDERITQDAKWGEQNHPDTYWLGIAMEELGEVAKALIEWDYSIDAPDPSSDLYTEIVQTEAVLRAWRECIHRRDLEPDDAIAGIISDQTKA